MEEYLAAWGRAEVIGPLGGGNRNTVLEVRIGRRRLAVLQVPPGAGQLALLQAGKHSCS